MHWFWRATIGTIAGAALLIVWAFIGPNFITSTSPIFFIVITILVLLISHFMAALIAGHLIAGQIIYDGETRCRKCQYILKGITEPICPECGERI